MSCELFVVPLTAFKWCSDVAKTFSLRLNCIFSKFFVSYLLFCLLLISLTLFLGVTSKLLRFVDEGLFE
jgi:hypothetical protein